MSASGGVSAEEVARFSALADRWWDPDGPMRPLHRMNPLRVGWIDARIRQRFDGGVRLLDVGCGAGLASEALAKAGHDVTGVDASEAAIAAARAHGGAAIDYRVGTAEDVLATGARFAAVTALEIIEHVPDQPGFMRTLATLLEPGGLVFVSTLNRTWRSLAVAKIGAEYIARLLPAGTHDWRRFVKPEELASMARDSGLRLDAVSGMVFEPTTRGWRESRDLSINYIAAFSRGRETATV
jgi:2-polyprenyl-6-hydroxyphenyl methylase/3-demethylubiquinone-9 3-methyltransferase